MSVMQPRTARDAWLRGHGDAVGYLGHGAAGSWRVLTGSDPTDKGYAERVFGALARDWKAGWDHGAALCAGGPPCCCQGESHMEGAGGHAYLMVRAGQHQARDTGPVCDDCASTCPAGQSASESGGVRVGPASGHS